MKQRVEPAIDEVLRPLLEAEGGGVDLLEVGPKSVSLRLRGKAAYGLGRNYIRTLVIEPLLRSATGVPDLEVLLEDEVTRPGSAETDGGAATRPWTKLEANDRSDT
jgi:hypothetical protein